ncbi:hypothetical protein FOZ60_012747 [Perkinsus olseni]|uniref:Uncharacterized protein n=1 Tax=Perkinsus olseni TaxID=32597 RepID=A0A7J6NAW2_PEROL|nr:hypothetical protein FOZ60_012747 [Perkinsus olseni]
MGLFTADGAVAIGKDITFLKRTGTLVTERENKREVQSGITVSTEEPPPRYRDALPMQLKSGTQQRRSAGMPPTNTRNTRPVDIDYDERGGPPSYSEVMAFDSGATIGPDLSRESAGGFPPLKGLDLRSIINGVDCYFGMQPDELKELQRFPVGELKEKIILFTVSPGIESGFPPKTTFLNCPKNEYRDQTYMCIGDYWCNRNNNPLKGIDSAALRKHLKALGSAANKLNLKKNIPAFPEKDMLALGELGRNAVVKAEKACCATLQRIERRYGTWEELCDNYR